VVREVVVESRQDGEPVIACRLGGDEAGAQAERWLRLGREAGLGRVETDDGLCIRFRDEPAAERELRALVAVESVCCAWARWDVRRVSGALVLQVHANPEGAAVLQAMFSVGAAGPVPDDRAAPPGEGSSPG
jgi:hypothetical protein